LTYSPKIMCKNKTTPRTSGTTRRQLSMIQLTLTTTVKVTRQTPSAMKKAIDFVRLEMRMRLSLGS